MNIVCTKCGTGVAFEMPALVNQTVVACTACRSGLRVTIEAFEAAVAEPSPQPAPNAPTRHVAVVAVQGEATRELIRDLLAAQGFDVVESSTGSEVPAKVRETRPSVVLIDVGLSDTPGFKVSETVRGDKANTGIKIILVAAIHNKDRYRRPPDNLFGADDYIERHQIESQLAEKVSRLCASGAPVGEIAGGSSAPQPEPIRREAPRAEPAPPQAPRPTGGDAPAAEFHPPRAQEPPPSPVRPSAPPTPTAVQPTPVQAAPPPAENRPAATGPAGNEGPAAGPAGAPAANPAQEAALRLARIIVSDIALYNAKKVDEGILNGTFFDLLRSEIEEGRNLYEERKGPGLATAVDLFQQTLEQFVATRRELLKRNRPAAA